MSHDLSDDVEMDGAAGHLIDDADEDIDDLFGNDQPKARITASPTASGPDSERLPSPERERRRALEYEEDDGPGEIAVQVKEAEVSFPNLPVPRSSDGNNWVIRTPNFVKMDTKPFHPDTYLGPEHEDEEFQGADSIREHSMSIKLKVENTIRWRWVKDAYGQDRRESNSRIIRWSDGTLSLRLGKEYFDIAQSIDKSATIQRSVLGAQPQSQSQTQTQTPASEQPPTSERSEGLTYLVAQHKRSQVLQSEAVITGYMALRPTGMQSQTHRMLVKAVGQKHNKVAKLRMVSEPTVDPEREKLELIKQSARKSRRPKFSYADEELGGGGGGGGRKKRSRRMVEGMYSDDEDERGMYAGGGSDEDEDDGMSSRKSSPRKPKRGGKSSEDRGEDYQADDFVVADESDEDADMGVGSSGGGGSGKGKKRPREASEEDDLERMEAKMEKQAAAERKARSTGGGGAGDGGSKKSSKKAVVRDEDDEDEDEDTDEHAGGAIDVESEEEEEEFRVRRVTGKRAIALEEEEEDE